MRTPYDSCAARRDFTQSDHRSAERAGRKANVEDGCTSLQKLAERLRIPVWARILDNPLTLFLPRFLLARLTAPMPAPFSSACANGCMFCRACCILHVVYCISRSQCHRHLSPPPSHVCFLRHCARRTSVPRRLLIPCMRDENVLGL